MQSKIRCVWEIAILHNPIGARRRQSMIASHHNNELLQNLQDLDTSNAAAIEG